MPPRTHRNVRRVLLEVCVESVDDAVSAVRAGAGRIELNAALALDGLSPSPGLLAEARRAVRVPLIAMARPRAGGFDYSPREFAVLCRDVECALEAGADGIALGLLTSERAVDTRRCRAALRRTGGRGEAVFHRAFDQVRDPLDALERLIDLGFRRIMTSGGAATALEGSAVLARLVERAAGRIEILPAGGVRPANAGRIVGASGCDQLHTSAHDRSGRMSEPAVAALARITVPPPLSR